MTTNLPSDATDYELVVRFTSYVLTTDQVGRCDHLRSAGLELARLITGSTPASREQLLALTHLEEAIMQANAAIARRELWLS